MELGHNYQILSLQITKMLDLGVHSQSNSWGGGWYCKPSIASELFQNPTLGIYTKTEKLMVAPGNPS